MDSQKLKTKEIWGNWIESNLSQVENVRIHHQKKEPKRKSLLLIMITHVFPITLRAYLLALFKPIEMLILRFSDNLHIM